MSIIQFPFVRLQYTGVDNPIYVTDVVCADQQSLDGITALAGLGASDFAILSGLEFVQSISGPNYYNPGIFYFNGVWYYQSTDFDENLYLAPNVTAIMPYTFADAVTRDLYQVNNSQTTTNPTGSTPQFTGNMNQYRLSNKYLASQIDILLLDVIYMSTLGATFTVDFTNDKSLFFTSATVSTVISFDFTGAIPGTVVTMKWTFASSETLSIPPAAGQTIYMESGDQSNVGSNINLMTMLYAGVNEIGQPEVRIVLSQPSIPA